MNTVSFQAPAGMKLNRERVGEGISDLSDAKVGETLDFKYYRGSNPGETRTVLVCKVDADGIQGIDQGRDGQWRHFLDEHADYIDVVEPFAEEAEEAVTPTNEVRIRFDEAGDRLVQSLDGEKLAQLYLQYCATEGESAKFDNVTGEVVITLPVPKNKVKDVGEDSHVTYSNKRGETLTQRIYADGTIGVCAGSYNEGDVSPEDFAVLLTRFLQ